MSRDMIHTACAIIYWCLGDIVIDTCGKIVHVSRADLDLRSKLAGSKIGAGAVTWPSESRSPG